MSRARPRPRRRSVLPGLCLVFALTADASPSPDTAILSGDPRAAHALQQFLARFSAAHQHSASRRLEASGSGQRAWLDVETEFSAGTGFSYEVVAEGGSRFIRARVLRSLLDEEQRIAARGRAGATLSPGNYRFVPEGLTGEGLAAVNLQPLRRDRSLVAGRMVLTLDGELVRIEGRLAKNPSFWVTRVDIVRSYRRINGVPMPVSLETTARLRLMGSSALRMTYDYSRVDDRLVEEAADAD